MTRHKGLGPRVFSDDLDFRSMFATGFAEWRSANANDWTNTIAGLAHVSVGHAPLIWVTEWPHKNQTQTKFRR